ncbi:GNAT family N-acetyltransferase [Taklimakanibacter deserti]|uniref:GNAT family N-acetyltransferase n=1 Tax=Taklimakanibacter deserti TaxID=2267839 RepID=UPI000E64C14A
MDQFRLRRLGASDAEAFRDVRLEGLRHHPEAFGSSWEEESERPLAWFEERLERNVVLAGCADDCKIRGIAALGVQDALKIRHKGFLWGMYVRPEARGSGLAAALVERLLSEARGTVEEVRLAVVTSNEAAIRLYTRHGFKQYGVERRALKIDHRYYDELLMAYSVGID